MGPLVLAGSFQRSVTNLDETIKDSTSLGADGKSPDTGSRSSSSSGEAAPESIELVNMTSVTGEVPLT